MRQNHENRGGIPMTREEIDIFIQAMKEIGDVYTPEQVEEEYGGLTLMEAAEKRLNKMQTFWDFVEEVVIPDVQKYGLWDGRDPHEVVKAARKSEKA
jgi:hypothetical protein